MDESINQRIEKIIKLTDKSVNAFAKRIGVAQTSLRDCIKKNAEPKFSTLYKIIKTEPDINPSWLLTGKGDIFTENNRYTTEKEIIIRELLLENRNLRKNIERLEKDMNELKSCL
jgi:hypothetical protein